MKRLIASIILGGSFFFFAPALAFADDEQPTVRDRVFVHLEGDERAQLERPSATDSSGWETVCYAPCDRELPVTTEYRIGGDGVRVSEPFYLERDRDRVDFEVQLATTRGHHAGIALVAVGTAAIGAGTILLSVAFYPWWSPGWREVYSALGTSPPVDAGFVVAGAVTAAVGVVAAISGAFIAANNSKSSVTPADVAPRTPTWRDASKSIPDPSHPMLVPLFSGRF